jgi:hypothetical protein
METAPCCEEARTYRTKLTAIFLQRNAASARAKPPILIVQVAGSGSAAVAKVILSGSTPEQVARLPVSQ